MSGEITSPRHAAKPAATAVRIAALVLLTLFILTLQIVLPWISFQHNSVEPDDPTAILLGSIPPDDSPFWRRRFRFEEFLSPGTCRRGMRSTVLSSTVFEDEIVILIQTDRLFQPQQIIMRGLFSERATLPERELLRISLHTGRMTRTPIGRNIDNVLSDGRTLWLLPKIYDQAEPFLWNGLPTVIRLYDDDRNSLSGLVQFVDGRWQDTDHRLLEPGIIRTRSICATGSQIHVLLEVDEDDFWYRVSLPVGSIEEAKQFKGRFPGHISEISAADLLLTGWRRVHHDHQRDELAVFPHNLGAWFEGDAPCFLRPLKPSLPENRISFAWYRYPADEPAQVRVVALPVPWAERSLDAYAFYGNTSSFVTLVNSADGTVYVVTHSDDDGRTHVLRWEDGEFRLVAQQASPLIGLVCLDAGLFFTLAFVAPMMLLTVIAWRWQRGAPRTFEFGLRSVALATAARRGVARLIDLTLILTPAILATVLHPDVMGWWLQVTGEAFDFYSAVCSLIFDPVGVQANLREVGITLAKLLPDLVSGPRLWGWSLAALYLLAVQIAWQALSGRTVGKKLLGLQVVQTTLQPCGLARSLLREILLAVDSLMLLSWVPGAIAILATERSQRLGDKWADTIVIRS